MTPTADLLRQLFHYDSKTGLVTRKVAVSTTTKVGDIVGTLHTKGYLRVQIHGKFYYLHRVIWCMETGFWPAGEIDHRDGVRSNNKWSNLRDGSKSSNGQNRSLSRNSTTGYTGVTFVKRRGNYQAYINSGGSRKNLGTFATAELAHTAYLQAKKTLHLAQPNPR